jgi:hypothetical protein
MLCAISNLPANVRGELSLSSCLRPAVNCQKIDKICPPTAGVWSKKWHGFGKIVSEFFIDRRAFPAKIFARFAAIYSTKIKIKLWQSK